MVGHKPPVIWSPEALDDVDRLWDYYAHIAGPPTADKVIREIAKVVKVLDDFPSAGRARDEIRAGLRSLAATPRWHQGWSRLHRCHKQQTNST